MARKKGGGSSRNGRDSRLSALELRSMQVSTFLPAAYL
jgi:ribosomal protein L27